MNLPDFYKNLWRCRINANYFVVDFRRASCQNLKILLELANFAFHDFYKDVDRHLNWSYFLLIYCREKPLHLDKSAVEFLLWKKLHFINSNWSCKIQVLCYVKNSNIIFTIRKNDLQNVVFLVRSNKCYLCVVIRVYSVVFKHKFKKIILVIVKWHFCVSHNISKFVIKIFSFWDDKFYIISHLKFKNLVRTLNSCVYTANITWLKCCVKVWI